MEAQIPAPRGSHFVSLDVGEALDAPDACPFCHAEGLVPVCGGGEVRFRCPSCDRTWRVELDTLVSVPSSSSDLRRTRLEHG